MEAIAFAILTAMLAVAAFTDWRWGKVYNHLTYPVMLLGLLYWPIGAWFVGDLSPAGGFMQALMGLLAGGLPLLIVRYMGALGGGDVKLMGAVGAVSASWACVLSTLVYALGVAVVMALIVMIATGRVGVTFQRLAGAALMTGGGVKPAVTFEDSPRIAFGVAIALGGIIAGAEQFLHVATPWAWLGP